MNDLSALSLFNRRRSRGTRRIQLNRPRLAALVAAAVASIALAGFAWYGRHQTDRRNANVTACLAAATPASQAIFSYDYRTFDAGVSNARSFLTGAFANDYATTTANLKATAVQARAIVQSQVSAVGVVDASPAESTRSSTSTSTGATSTSPARRSTRTGSCSRWSGSAESAKSRRPPPYDGRSSNVNKSLSEPAVQPVAVGRRTAEGRHDGASHP